MRAALAAPRGPDGVFVATSVRDGDAVGAIRDGAGEQPVVLRAELLSSRFATVPMQDVARAVLLVVLQHAALLVLAVVVSALLAGWIDAWT